MWRIALAGTPPTTALAGTSFVTTAPAATTAPADGHPGQYGGVGTDPDPFSNVNGGRKHVAAPLRLHGVVQGSQHHIVADEGAVLDENAPLILELAAHVDEDLFADVDVLAAVRVKGREQPKALIHRLADELGEELPQLLRRVVAGVDLGGDAQGLLAGPVHELMGLAPRLHRFPAAEVIEKFT